MHAEKDQDPYCVARSEAYEYMMKGFTLLSNGVEVLG